MRTYEATFGVLEPVSLHSLDIDSASFDTNPDPRFGRILKYWTRLSTAKKALPARSDIDAIELGIYLLPNLFLVDIICEESGRTRFKYRLVGGAIAEAEPARRGIYVDQLASGNASTVEQYYFATAKGRIAIRQSNLGWLNKAFEYKNYAFVVLPLANDGKTPTHLLGLSLYHETALGSV